MVVEDERSIADLISLYLRREGFGVHVESHGDRALAALARLHPVAVVLDVGIPGPDGIEVCRRLRARDDWTPVIFVTARDDEVDRVLGLELGADDYVTKPFSPRELVARVRAVLRRSSGRQGQADTITVGRVRLDANQHRVWADEVAVTLTSTEFDLLEHLMRSPGRVFSREQLLSTVWGYEAAAGSRTVDVHVAQLRGKLGDASPIRTVRGVGYAADNHVRRPTSLAVRITALCLAVAAVALAVAGLVAVRLVGVTAHDVTRTSLQHQADVIAGQVEEAGLASPQGLRRVAQVLAGQGVSVMKVRQGTLIGPDAQADSAAQAAGAASLGSVSTISTSESVGGHTLLVEGRAVSPRAGFALVQPVTAGSDTRHQLTRYILFALAIGLGVAAVAGLLLGRVLSRPLRRTADVARTMSAGRRDLRVAVEGPAEVADVASSVNELAEALERSERRQRDFLLSVSHELRTPLTSAMGFAESLKDGVATGDDAVLAGRTIYEETRRLDHLVSDLLDLARMGADEFRLDVRRNRSRAVGRGDGGGVDDPMPRGGHRFLTRSAGLRRPARSSRQSTPSGCDRCWTGCSTTRSAARRPAVRWCSRFGRPMAGRITARSSKSVTAVPASPPTISQSHSSGGCCTAATPVADQAAPGSGWHSSMGW